MTRADLDTLAVGSLVREYQTGFYADRDAPVEKFGRPQRVCEIFHRGVSRKGKAYVNLFFHFGEGLKLSATIVEDDPTWQLEGHENAEQAKEFVKRRNLSGATGHRLLVPSDHVPLSDSDQ